MSAVRLPGGLFGLFGNWLEHRRRGVGNDRAGDFVVPGLVALVDDHPQISEAEAERRYSEAQHANNRANESDSLAAHACDAQTKEVHRGRGCSERPKKR